MLWQKQFNVSIYALAVRYPHIKRDSQYQTHVANSTAQMQLGNKFYANVNKVPSQRKRFS